MDVALTYTKQAVLAAANSYLEPVDFLRALNSASPRNWRVDITFDGVQRNVVHLSPEPVLSDAEVVQLLDGRAPALYWGESLRVRTSAGGMQVSAFELHQFDAPLAVRFTSAEAAAMRGQLEIFGYPHTPELHHSQRLQQWLRKNTWFGARRLMGRHHELFLDVFGSRSSYKCLDLALAQPTRGPGLRVERAIQDGADFLCSAVFEFSLSGRNSIRHWRYGEFDPNRFVPDFWKQFNCGRTSNVLLEIDDPGLSWWTTLGPQDATRIRRLLHGLLRMGEKLASDEKFLRYADDVARYEKEIAASQLTLRQQALGQRAKVRYRGTVLFAEPAYESELVSLYMKLEAANALPFECRVLEYTGKVGIDALGDFRFQSAEMLLRNAPIEFEIQFENFIDHAHPIEQTALIICWDAAEPDFLGEGRLPGKPWLRTYRCDGREIPVVLLKFVPGIEVG